MNFTKALRITRKIIESVLRIFSLLIFLILLYKFSETLLINRSAYQQIESTVEEKYDAIGHPPEVDMGKRVFSKLSVGKQEISLYASSSYPPGKGQQVLQWYKDRLKNLGWEFESEGTVETLPSGRYYRFSKEHYHLELEILDSQQVKLIVFPDENYLKNYDFRIPPLFPRYRK